LFVGYGATTLPGVTEALRFDRNATRAEEEVERVRVLVDRLAEMIRP
jgi:N-acetylated-alpha-linked acidic dipeptidase